ncbi:helix-turn-helix transcriptional regulator [Sphingomonas sp. LB3N6]|uniref:helix-turn-helix domain-containing protein n=1 Tax=Sphingomonas fucosidasi TaxID=3096164 RepID=UPI002FCBD90D
MTVAPAPEALTAAIVAPSITPGTYIRLRREAAGLTIENVAMMIESDPPVCVQRRIQGLTMIEADIDEISPSTAMVLHDVIGVDLRILAYWMAIAEGATPPPVGVVGTSNCELPA